MGHSGRRPSVGPRDQAVDHCRVSIGCRVGRGGGKATELTYVAGEPGFPPAHPKVKDICGLRSPASSLLAQWTAAVDLRQQIWRSSNWRP